MSKMILHSYRRCPFAIRVRMVLEEKSISYLVIEESLKNKSKELLSLHPEGKVPLLIHDDFVLYQSSIITEYLEDVFPTPRLRPTTPVAKAQIRLWTYWCDSIFKPDLDQFKYKWRLYNDIERSNLVERINSHLKTMETALLINPYLMGPGFSLADIHLFPFYRQLKKASPEFTTLFSSQNQCTKLDEWLKRIEERPSFTAVMER